MSSTEVRKRRDEQQVEIRRQRREENLAKRRNMPTGAAGADSDDDGAGEWDSEVSKRDLKPNSLSLKLALA